MQATGGNTDFRKDAYFWAQDPVSGWWILSLKWTGWTLTWSRKVLAVQADVLSPDLNILCIYVFADQVSSGDTDSEAIVIGSSGTNMAEQVDPESAASAGAGRSGAATSTTLELPVLHTRSASGPTTIFTADSAKEDSGDDATIPSRQVTLEARKVLEQFLKRSLSHNDASPYQREQQATELELIEEHPDPEASGSVLRSESYQNAAIENPYYMYGPHMSAGGARLCLCALHNQ